MSMHTELMTVNKRDWERMITLLHKHEKENAELKEKIQKMKEAIALVIDQNL